MRNFFSLLCMALLAAQSLWAEGTRELAPNPSINVNGNLTTDIAALHINNPSYNSFASYTNPDPQSRLYIHIKNPVTECIYLGFNWAHNNVTSNNPPRINFEYRIKDPDGNIVFGPVTVTPANANIQTWSQANIGPEQLYGPGGYIATVVNSTDLLSQGWTEGGEYYIEFRDFENNDLLIDFWDITVVDCFSGPDPVEKKGRVWSYNWSIFAINDYGFPNRPFNGAFYVCAPDPDHHHASFVTKIDFNGSGFRPAAFNVAFNSFGSTNTGNLAEDRKSVELTNSTQAEYSIFLNDPVDICETAEVGGIEIVGVSRCSGNDYCVKVIAHKAGQINLLLDFDGEDGVFTPGTADVSIVFSVSPEQVGLPICIPWNGLNGLGETMSESIATRIPVVINFAQGIYHFPIYDAELMTNGFQISSIRPSSAVSLVYYDDSNISVSSGSGEPKVQLAGCMPPCHRWTNYIDPNIPGFGNLNTINSWWFSQLIIRQEVFFIPSYYACSIDGPGHMCQGGTAELAVTADVFPPGGTGGEIVSTHWEGAAIIGADDGSSVTIGEGGTYAVTMVWINDLGDTCTSVCTHSVITDPPLTATIDTLMVRGETITINGEVYTTDGQYVQHLVTAEGCDSILTINIIVLNAVVYYDLDNCESFMSDGSNMDFSEFVPSYPQPLTCAEITAGILHRNNPQMNKHSCTPGLGGSPGMCVGALDTCFFAAGHDASVIIEIEVVPHPDTAVYLTGFSFYEQAPLDFVWTSGPTGPNNYPQVFGVRVLKNGVEIYRDENILTQPSWNQRVFEFLGNTDFLVRDPSLFRFELLAYCPVGNGAVESVWDLEDVRFFASCASPGALNKSISGHVVTWYGVPMQGIGMTLYGAPGLDVIQQTVTSSAGEYVFENVVPGRSYFIGADHDLDARNGVSTLDIVRMQRYLLGMGELTSPYQLIAADINRSSSITALDIIELRRLILGIYTKFPANTSWRFANAVFPPEIHTPWTFSENHYIEHLTDHIPGLDFTGVKTGDLDGTAAVNVRDEVPVLPRNAGSVSLVAVVPRDDTGGRVMIDIMAEEAVPLAGMQMSLVGNGSEITGVKPGKLAIGAEHFFITADGILRISWHDISPVALEPGDVLFSLIAKKTTPSDGQILWQPEYDLLCHEAYLADDLSVVPIVIREAPAEEIALARSGILSADPNPFAEAVTVRFELDVPGEAVLSAFDLSGRLLFERSGRYEKGRNSIIISAGDLGGFRGIMIFRLRANGTTDVRKMVRME